jgi:hypothetical protein
VYSSIWVLSEIQQSLGFKMKTGGLEAQRAQTQHHLHGSTHRRVHCASHQLFGSALKLGIGSKFEFIFEGIRFFFLMLPHF